jgi:hypothetical protein
LLALLAGGALTLVLWIVKTEPKRTQLITEPLSKQLDETVRLLASKDALTYSELEFARTRSEQMAEYEKNARYYSGDTYAAEEARLAGELADDIAIDKEDLDAITAVIS